MDTLRWVLTVTLFTFCVTAGVGTEIFLHFRYAPAEESK